MTFGRMLGLVIVFAMISVPLWAIIAPWALQVPRIGKPLAIALTVLAAAWIAYGTVMA